MTDFDLDELNSDAQYRVDVLAARAGLPSLPVYVRETGLDAATRVYFLPALRQHRHRPPTPHRIDVHASTYAELDAPLRDALLAQAVALANDPAATQIPIRAPWWRTAVIRWSGNTFWWVDLVTLAALLVVTAMTMWSWPDLVAVAWIAAVLWVIARLFSAADERELILRTDRRAAEMAGAPPVRYLLMSPPAPPLEPTHRLLRWHRRWLHAEPPLAHRLTAATAADPSEDGAPKWC
ncbi:hypothetical protein [Nocardia puris]|uniref:Uncharacterized protein n=1 Tax=Nocardia puris TaxID=208602 RepID=A0A366D5N5_9NOCA|nr:hypothetical protein [Nocardia puris]RBO85340.1 hypothetical protein DFR74_115188 [Nocardia puris]